MKCFLIIVLLAFPLLSFAQTTSGIGGIPECVSLSVRAALDAYSKTNSLNQIPLFEVRPNSEECAPTNGIDFVIVINNQTRICVTAQPSLSDEHVLLGCTDAKVMGITNLK